MEQIDQAEKTDRIKQINREGQRRQHKIDKIETMTKSPICHPLPFATGHCHLSCAAAICCLQWPFAVCRCHLPLPCVICHCHLPLPFSIYHCHLPLPNAKIGKTHTATHTHTHALIKKWWPCELPAWIHRSSAMRRSFLRNESCTADRFCAAEAALWGASFFAECACMMIAWIKD